MVNFILPRREGRAPSPPGVAGAAASPSSSHLTSWSEEPLFFDQIQDSFGPGKSFEQGMLYTSSKREVLVQLRQFMWFEPFMERIAFEIATQIGVEMSPVWYVNGRNGVVSWAIEQWKGSERLGYFPSIGPPQSPSDLLKVNPHLGRNKTNYLTDYDNWLPHLSRPQQFMGTDVIRALMQVFHTNYKNTILIRRAGTNEKHEPQYEARYTSFGRGMVWLVLGSNAFAELLTREKALLSRYALPILEKLGAISDQNWSQLMEKIFPAELSSTASGARSDLSYFGVKAKILEELKKGCGIVRAALPALRMATDVREVVVPNIRGIQAQRDTEIFGDRAIRGPLPQQSTLPIPGTALLEGLGIKSHESLWCFAGYSGDWAVGLKNSGVKNVVYTDIDPHILAAVRAMRAHELTDKGADADEVIRRGDPLSDPKDPHLIDWSFSYEPIPIYFVEWPMVVLRSLLNRKGMIIVSSQNASLQKVRDVLNVFAEVYNMTGKTEFSETPASPSIWSDSINIQRHLVNLEVKRNDGVTGFSPMLVTRITSDPRLRKIAAMDSALIDKLTAHPETSVSELVSRLDYEGMQVSVRDVEMGLRRIELIFSKQPQRNGVTKALRIPI